MPTRAVQAAAPYYGVYDLTDPAKMHEMMMQFLELFVMKEQYADNPEIFELASPISHVHRDAPPFFVLHGESDSVIPTRAGAGFRGALREAGAPTVGYAELPNAHHAFDSVRHRPVPVGRRRGRGLPGCGATRRHVRARSRAARKRAAPTG